MTDGRPETIENRWDVLYRDYPEVYDEFIRIGRDTSVYRHVFGSFPFTDKVVADIGSGTGRSTFAIARRAKHVIGVEPEIAMQRIARSEAERLELRNIEFVTGSGEKLPLPDRSVDIVTAFTLAIYPPQRFRYFAEEALRVVRSGGYVISVNVTPFWYGGDLAEVILGPERVTASNTEGVIDWIFVQGFGFEYADVESAQDYGSVDRLVGTYGFIFGRKAIDYVRAHQKTTIRWRNRIHFKHAV